MVFSPNFNERIIMKKIILSIIAGMMTFSASANDSILSVAKGIGTDNYNILAGKADIAIPDFGKADRNTNTPEVLIGNVSSDLRDAYGNHNFGVRIEYDPTLTSLTSGCRTVAGGYTFCGAPTVTEHQDRKRAVVLANERDSALNIVINSHVGQSSFDNEGGSSGGMFDGLTGDTVFIAGGQQDVTAIAGIILDEMNSNPDFDKDVFQEHIVESLDGGVFSPANFARALRSPAGSLQ